MYHYRESGLPNVYLRNGFREIETPYGTAVQIENVDGLHRSIARVIAERSPRLTGAEVRFIRRMMDRTQGEFAQVLGVSENAARRWESLRAVPQQADRSVRLLCLNFLQEVQDFERLMSERPTRAQRVSLRHRAQQWTPQAEAA